MLYEQSIHISGTTHRRPGDAALRTMFAQVGFNLSNLSMITNTNPSRPLSNLLNTDYLPHPPLTLHRAPPTIRPLATRPEPANTLRSLQNPLLNLHLQFPIKHRSRSPIPLGPDTPIPEQHPQHPNHQKGRALHEGVRSRGVGISMPVPRRQRIRYTAPLPRSRRDSRSTWRCGLGRCRPDCSLGFRHA